MHKTSKFWDRTADRYARQPIADMASYRKKLQVTGEYLQPSMRVVELGCGTGSTAIALAPSVKSIRAIDISSKMIAIARGKADAEGVTNISFEHSAIDALHIAEHSVDTVLAFSILHLLNDRRQVIADIYNGLKPGGVFVSSTACIGDSAIVFRLIAPLAAVFGLIPSVDVFTATELQNDLTEAGFEIDYRWKPDKAMAVFIVAKKVSA